MNNELLYPLIASILTLIITKGVDLFMQGRREKVEYLQHQLGATDEISKAAEDTIRYLSKEVERIRARKIALEIELDEKNKIIREQARELAKCSNGY